MDSAKIADDVYKLAESDELIAPLVKEAIAVIEQALDTHGQDRISISFNGGKDCTVLLYIYAGVLARRSKNVKQKIHAIYIAVPSPFSDLEAFIERAAKDYNLDLFHCRPPEEEETEPVESVITPSAQTPVAADYTLSRPKAAGKAKGGLGMLHALEIYKQRFPKISAILIGTRRSDPHGAILSHRNMTDAGWPQYERVNPIINWDYADVWTFLRQLQVPYCSLYDEGYTSLGSTYNTFPNPALLCSSNDEKPQYNPAFQLSDGNLERCGRGMNPSAIPAALKA